jgi:hypothetical protein
MQNKVIPSCWYCATNAYVAFTGFFCRCCHGFFQPCNHGFFTREKPRHFIVGDFWGFLRKTRIFPTKKVLSRPRVRKKLGKIPVFRRNPQKSPTIKCRGFSRVTKAVVARLKEAVVTPAKEPAKSCLKVFVASYYFVLHDFNHGPHSYPHMNIDQIMLHVHT